MFSKLFNNTRFMYLMLVFLHLSTILGCGNGESIDEAPPSVEPVASFMLQSSTFTVGEIVEFIDTSSDPNGKIVSWEWQFGDGSSSELRNPSHQYASIEQSYPVRLCVKDDDGLEACSAVAHISFGSRFSDLKKSLDNPLGPPMVLAHRACHTNAPENSLQAIRDCIDSGVEMIEVDLRLTADNRVVLMHDSTLDRTTNFDSTWAYYDPLDSSTNKVSHHTVDELKSLLLLDKQGNPSNETIVTLEEAMNVAKNNIFVMIDKWDSHVGQPFDNLPPDEDPYQLLRPIIRDLNSTGTLDHAVFIGFHSFSTINQLFSAIPAFGNVFDNADPAMNINYVPGLHRSLPDSELAGQSLTDYLNAFINADRTNNNFDIKAFAAWFKTETDDVLDPIQSPIDAVLNAGKRLWVNVTLPKQCAGHDDSLLDRDVSWGWVLDLGASMLLTDEPFMMKSYFEEITTRNVYFTVDDGDDLAYDTEFPLNRDVIFQNKSSIPLDLTESILWNFGDGNASSENNPIHSFQIHGTFDVELTITVDGVDHKFVKSVQVI